MAVACTPRLHFFGSKILLQILEVIAKVFRCLIAPLRVLRKRTPDDARQVTRKSRSDISDGSGRVFKEARKRGHLCFALERPLSGRHLIEYDAKREDVRPVVDGLSLSW